MNRSKSINYHYFNEAIFGMKKVIEIELCNNSQYIYLKIILNIKTNKIISIEKVVDLGFLLNFELPT
jgi:hypothetical protein